MFEKYPDIVTVDMLMEMLSLGRNSVYSLLKNNEIRHVKLGRKYIIPKMAVISFIDSMCYNEDKIICEGLQFVREGEAS